MEDAGARKGREGYLLPFHTGDLSDDFTLNPGVVGHGQFGVVKPCVHLSTGKVMACKTVQKMALQTEQQREGLKTEVAVMKHLVGHPNVVDLVAVYEDRETVQLVMEFCAGGDLFDLIAAAKAFREPEAAWLFRKVVAAVDFCHKRGVVHRDIKPENILLSMGASVEPKLADFGLAVVLPPGHFAHGLAGSPFYMAPEVIKGQLYGAAADVWSCGVLLYIMLSGVLPFWGSNPLQTFASVCRGQLDLEFPPWETVSSHAKRLIASMLSQDPRCRPSADAILYDPWLLSFGTGPAATVPPPPPSGGPKNPRPQISADSGAAAAEEDADMAAGSASSGFSGGGAAAHEAPAGGAAWGGGTAAQSSGGRRIGSDASQTAVYRWPQAEDAAADAGVGGGGDVALLQQLLPLERARRRGAEPALPPPPHPADSRLRVAGGPEGLCGLGGHGADTDDCTGGAATAATAHVSTLLHAAAPKDRSLRRRPTQRWEYASPPPGPVRKRAAAVALCAGDDLDLSLRTGGGGRPQGPTPPPARRAAKRMKLELSLSSSLCSDGDESEERPAAAAAAADTPPPPPPPPPPPLLDSLVSKSPSGASSVSGVSFAS